MKFLSAPFYLVLFFVTVILSLAGFSHPSITAANTAGPFQQHLPLVMTHPPIRFAVIGDYGTGGQAEAAVAALVASLDPDFIITTGDNSYGTNPIDENIGQFYRAYIGNYSGSYGPGSILNRFFPSLGNHDWGDGGGIAAYLAYFTLPGPGIATTGTSGNERYYDFIWGPVHFFALDSDHREPHGRSATSIQAQWLQTQLTLSTSPWKIVYMHEPPYTSSAAHESSVVMQWPYEAWGVTAVFSGHAHVYERLFRDDNRDGAELYYFINGLGGASKYEFGEIVPGSQVRYNEDYGAMLVTATKTTITFEFYALTSDTPIDVYSIQPSFQAVRPRLP